VTILTAQMNGQIGNRVFKNKNHLPRWVSGRCSFQVFLSAQREITAAKPISTWR
jgi:hypothetical protein